MLTVRRMGDELEVLRQRILEGKGEVSGRGGGRQGSVLCSLYCPLQVCEEQLAELRDWSVGVEEEEQQKMLHVEGERELEGLGERWHSRFPKLLDDYTPGDFVFR